MFAHFGPLKIFYDPKDTVNCIGRQIGSYKNRISIMKEIEKYLGGRSIFTNFLATEDLLWPKGQTILY